MRQPRIHITGASGAGVTTLGSSLARYFRIPQLDADRFYWEPTDPPFTRKRHTPDRLRLIHEAKGSGGWVLSGSVCGWGDSLMDEVDLIIFMRAPLDVRLGRLRSREAAHFGTRIAPGGDMHRIHTEFLQWAQRYDDPSFRGRSLVNHELWLDEQDPPILRLSGEDPVDDLTRRVCARFELLTQS